MFGITSGLTGGGANYHVTIYYSIIKADGSISYDGVPGGEGGYFALGNDLTHLNLKQSDGVILQPGDSLKTVAYVSLDQDADNTYQGSSLSATLTVKGQQTNSPN
ncbi:hypothetical protein [Paenibacillus sp. OV219]|uniref:hypothetical protein n=1 Tax=Paenibacillus sp. OV219 TaxID=1884377 RepID=UPI0008AFE9E2|nr:hypothetical protein [Paenibacillus sp. OV219]SEP02677.1 hypothetical protein SAMN05518847_114104 [Paenibacillus sp. OV219]